MDLGIDGKRALITGAAGGMGRATAELLAGAGVSLTLTDVPGADLSDLGKKLDARTCAADLSSLEGVEALLATVGSEFDILLHLAGGYRRQGRPDADGGGRLGPRARH